MSFPLTIEITFVHSSSISSKLFNKYNKTITSIHAIKTSFRHIAYLQNISQIQIPAANSPENPHLYFPREKKINPKKLTKTNIDANHAQSLLSHPSEIRYIFSGTHPIPRRPSSQKNIFIPAPRIPPRPRSQHTYEWAANEPSGLMQVQHNAAPHRAPLRKARVSAAAAVAARAPIHAEGARAPFARSSRNHRGDAALCAVCTYIRRGGEITLALLFWRTLFTLISGGPAASASFLASSRVRD